MSQGQAATPQLGKCERVVITTQDGRVFDLGPPDSVLFRLKVKQYKWQRRHEIRAADE